MMSYEVTFPGGVKTKTTSGDFTWMSDQSADEGGENSAPSPFATFLAGLASCSAIYVLRFLQSREIPTEDLKLGLDFEYNKEDPSQSKVTMNIKVPAEFPEKYDKALIRTAGLCAVKKQIINAPQFETQVIR